ncbi:hypothetical protein BH11MYX1_BH11MYX1_11980 [soil metagenome]
MVALVAACGKKTAAPPDQKDAGAAKVFSAPIALPPLGVDKIARFNFLWNDGATAYDKARAAYKTKAWPIVRAACELAVGKDPTHFEAQRLLAIALSQQGEHAAAVDHIVAAIAGDYWRYGPAFAIDPELDAFRATPHGQAVTALASQIHDEYVKRTKTALWLIGRRSTFKWPAKDGVQLASSRGELYAYDRETHRYFRLTHTDHQVLGVVREANEVAVLGFDKIDHPKADDAAPLFARAWITMLDPVEWKPIGKRIELATARAVAVGYGDDARLIVGTAPAAGRWGLGDWTVSAVDQTTAKLAKVSQPLPVPRLEATLDEGRVVHPAAIAGVEAAWNGDPATAPALKLATGGTAQVPETHAAAHDTVAVAPGGARVAFATAVDPCAKEAVPSLYVADSKTGALKHLLTARSRFVTRWLDATTLIYEDGEGALRLWDATTGREAMRLDNKAGIALDVLSLASAPLCKQATTAVETSAGSDDALPPETTTP